MCHQKRVRHFRDDLSADLAMVGVHLDHWELNRKAVSFSAKPPGSPNQPRAKH